MSDNGHLTWTNERRKLSDLIPWEENPRQSTKDQAKRIEGSIRKFGYSQPIEIEPDNTIIDGHQRDPVMTMMAEYGQEAEIDVRVASRKMTLDERKEYIALKHQGAVGEWNWEGMHNLYDGQELLEWGFDQKDLEFHGFEFGEDNEDVYTRKIETPIYTPKGEKPKAVDLYNEKRTLELLAAIESAELPEDEKEFLRVAARRHTVLDFEKIAEFYAHSSVEVQALMEDSALVIIDFERAIELGFVKLSEKIAEQFTKDYGTR